MARTTPSVDLFSRRPAPDQMPVRYELERVPPDGFKNLIILSHDVLGTDTHFWGGHTIPHLPKKCPACDANCRLEWRGYMFVLRPAVNEMFVVEVTPAVMGILDDAFCRNRTLTGSKLSLSRKAKRPNGQMHATIAPPRGEDLTLPEAPSTRKFLQRLWRLPEPEFRQPITDDTLKLRGASDLQRIDQIIATRNGS